MQSRKRGLKLQDWLTPKSGNSCHADGQERAQPASKTHHFSHGAWVASFPT